MNSKPKNIKITYIDNPENLLRLILLILLSFHFSWAQEVSEEYGDDDVSPWSFNLDLTGGYSSNVANFKGSPSDSFIQVSPRAQFVKNIGQNTYIDLSANGFLRNFNDRAINDQFRVMFYEGNGTLGVFLSEHFEVGGKLSGTSFWGREVDLNNVGGRDSRFYTLEGLAFLNIHNNKGFIELQAGNEIQRALTPITDEAGNVFNNDYNAPKLHVGYQTSFDGPLNGSVAYEFQNRVYTEQRSRLFNGSIAPNFDTPFADEYIHSVDTSLYLYNLNAQFRYQRIIDNRAGAETRDAYMARVSLPFGISQYISLIPGASWSPTYYDKFIGNIILDPNATELREDNFYSYSLETILYLGWFNPVLLYRHTTLDSNYSLINFEEDLFSAGFRINL